MSPDTASAIPIHDDRTVKRISIGPSSTEPVFDNDYTQQQATGERLADWEFKSKVSQPAQRTEEQVKDGNRASPENLYQVIGDSSRASVPVILRIRQSLNDGQKCLQDALSEFSNEIERETQIDLFFNCVRRIASFPSQSRHFPDAMTGLIVALESHLTQAYSRQEIVALKKVTELLKDNPVMKENTLDEILDTLEDAGFDLSYPFKEIDFDELL